MKSVDQNYDLTDLLEDFFPKAAEKYQEYMDCTDDGTLPFTPENCPGLSEDDF